MRKGMWSAAALVTLVAAGILVGAPTLRAADSRVAMGSSDEPLKFLPAEISVPVGGTVQWFNDTEIQHDVSADDGSFDSKGLLGKGQKYEFTFTKAGEFKYFCTPHKDAGMKGVVKVTSAGTPTTAPATPTTQVTATTVPSQGAPTPVTARASGTSSTTTTTTTRAGSSSGPSSTTTTTAGGAGVTSTTQAPSVTPTSAPETASETTTTTAAGHASEESAASDHASEGGSERKKKKNSPIGIVFASVSTVLLAAIAGKLLASKS